MTEWKARIECGGWRALGVGLAAGGVWLALVGGCAGPAKPGPGGAETKGIAAGSEGMEGGPARPLPTLEEELEARRERERLKARASGLPTLEEELKAKEAREGKAAPAAAVATSPAAPVVPPVAEPAAEGVKEAAVTAEEFRPGWWVEAPVEKDGVVRVAAKGEGATLVEARRAAVEAGREVVRDAVGAGGRVGEAPVHSAAVRLGDGRYRAFVMMEGKR